MRKIILISLTLFISNGFLLAQLSGEGTESNPYYGSINTNTTWNPGIFPGDIVYVSGIVPNFYIRSTYSLTISAGVTVYITGILVNNGSLVIKPGGALTVETLWNNYSLKLESDATGIASLIYTNYSGSGSTQTQLYLTGGYTTSGGTNYYKWHYISPPVTSIPASIFTINTLNLARYDEGLVSNNILAGWVASDGYNYIDGSSSTPWANLLMGQGYDYYHTVHETYTINGTLNFQDVPVSMTFSGANPDISGFNLIGNPFPSCLDWDYIFFDYYNENLPQGLNDAIYFTANDKSATYVGGVGQGGGTGIIPPMQGFFVKVTQEVGTFILPAAARVHDMHQMRYKGSDKNENLYGSIPLIRLKFENEKDSDDVVIRFNSKATPSFDKSFDAYKFNKEGGIISIWTKIRGIDYSINGLSFPETSVEIPVEIFASEEGIFKLSANELKNLDNYYITLKDLSTNIIADLRKGEGLKFYMPSGINEDRFLLKIIDKSTGISENNQPEKKFSLYSTTGIINLIPLTDEFSNNQGTVILYDLTGRKVFQQNNIEFHKGELIQVHTSNQIYGLFLVEIKTGTLRYADKIKVLR